MKPTVMHIPQQQYDVMQAHLLPHTSACEQAGFACFRTEQDDSEFRFDLIEWLPVQPSGLAAHSPYYLELNDHTRAAVIKRAHDLNASLVEFHSHPSPYPAAFSFSDFSGFEEFVPHVWWRLKGRPYAAAVVAPGSFDALVWLTDPRQPQPLNAIVTDQQRLKPTALSLREANNE